MLATRQVLGNVARSRAVGGAASSGIRRMATVSDSPLDRKVRLTLICVASPGARPAPALPDAASALARSLQAQDTIR